MVKVGNDVDSYIAGAPKDAQPKLRELRKIIQGVVPKAKESISYKMPFYNYKGRMAWFGMQRSHIGLYIRPPIIEKHKKDLSGYTTTKSAVHLSLDKKIPAALVRKLLIAAKKQNEVRSKSGNYW